MSRWQERRAKLEADGKDAPFWSSAQERYCTSDMKRGPINIQLRKSKFIISAEGIRAQESPSRAKQPVFEKRTSIWTRDRRAYNWHPIHDWTLKEVFEECGTSFHDLGRRRGLYKAGFHEDALNDWPMHPAYVFGNERVSCALCVLASRNDLRVGATHNPELYQILTGMEKESGWSFRHKDALTYVFEDKPRAIEDATGHDQMLWAVEQQQLGLEFPCI